MKDDVVVHENGRDREFSFTQRDFDVIRRIVKEHTGIALSDAKKDMVYSRLARRIRQLGLETFKEYCSLLEEGHEDEFVNFVNAITTNLTSFFREAHHFAFLASNVLPGIERNNNRDRRIRIWSAGCSTGEEPYSLAMTVHESLALHEGWDLKILATDLDSNVLAKARGGVYAAERIAGLPKARRTKWFLKGKGGRAGNVKASSDLQALITFNQLNLMNDWPMRGPFDVIFCRNVVIYFDKDTQRRLFDRFADILSDDGYLFVGHSESLYKVTNRFELVGNTIYRKR